MKDRVPVMPEPSASGVSLGDVAASEETWRHAWMDARIRWSLAVQVRDLRASRGMSRWALARLSGVSIMTIWRIENASRHSVALRSLVKIASAFDVAFMAYFGTWGAWLDWQRRIERGETVPACFEEEVLSPSSTPHC